MKKILSLVSVIILLFTLCGCDFFTADKNSIGKTSSTAMTAASALESNFALRKMEGYKLYGIKLTVNSENVGRYTYVYTDKAPSDVRYSDILVVEVNTLNGKIEKISSPDYKTYGQEPYDMIRRAMPLDVDAFAIDSDDAVRTAAKCHFGNNFVYNFIETIVTYDYGTTVYKVNHISLVNDCIYTTVIDALTGTVINFGREALVK